MPPTNDGMYLLDPRGLLELANRVDDSRVAARRDHDQASVLSVVSGCVLAPENVLHQISRLGFHLDRAGRKMERSITSGASRTRFESSGRRGHLESGDTWNVTRSHCMAGHGGRLLRERDF